MDRITLKSGLSGFVILDEILDAGPDTITGCRSFERAAPYLGIEALAQLGAYHVRFLCDFEKHAFLLGVKSCSLPRANELNGRFRLFGRTLSRSSSAFAHHLTATGEDGTAIEGEFLFALAGYSEAGFNRDILRDHYRKVFSCLRNTHHAVLSTHH